METVDPEEEGLVTYERFLEVAALKMKCGFHWQFFWAKGCLRWWDYR